MTIHGSADEIVPSDDAFEFDKIIPNHKLHIIEGADHCYTAHQEEFASLVLDFIKSAQVHPFRIPRKTLSSRLWVQTPKSLFLVDVAGLLS